MGRKTEDQASEAALTRVTRSTTKSDGKGDKKEKPQQQQPQQHGQQTQGQQHRTWEAIGRWMGWRGSEALEVSATALPRIEKLLVKEFPLVDVVKGGVKVRVKRHIAKLLDHARRVGAENTELKQQLKEVRGEIAAYARKAGQHLDTIESWTEGYANLSGAHAKLDQEHEALLKRHAEDRTEHQAALNKVKNAADCEYHALTHRYLAEKEAIQKELKEERATLK